MTINDWLWIIPITLLVIVVFQVIYIIWLARALRGKRASRRPTTPIMPTQPPTDGLDSTNHRLADGTLGKLVIIKGVPDLKEIPLPSNSFRIGRFYNPDSNVLVAFDERSISRQHALFVSDETTREYYLTDTNSSYGTRVQIAHRFEPLPPGREQRIYNEDVVQFGTAVTARFVLPCETRPAGAKPY